MSAALFEASWEGLKCSSAGLSSSSAPIVPQSSNTFFRRRALRVHLRFREDQGHSAFEQRGCRDGQLRSKVQAFRREGGPALADLHTGNRGQLFGSGNGVDVSGASTAGREDLSPLQLKAEGANGAGRSNHASGRINGADRMFANDAVANGAASLQEVRAGDPASQGPASALEEVMQGADEPAASASSAKNRMQMDLDRQRSKEGMNLAMRSRKEVLRQLRTGEEGGLPEAERLRRLRISAANKGRVPWNVGRKHSPETIEKIRQGTTKAMQDPTVRQKLVVSHEPKMHTESSLEKISRGVTLARLRREGVDLTSMTEDEVNALVEERKAARQAKAAAKQARRAQKERDMEALQQLDEHYDAHHRRHMLSKDYIERLRNGDFTSPTVTAAEMATAPRRRKAARKAAVRASPEQASDAEALPNQASATSALPKQPAARRRPAVPGAATAAAKKRAAAEAAAAAGEARAGQLKRALMLVIKLEQALEQCYNHQEATVRSASTEERERVENVVANAREQLLRAKVQVARLQQGTPVSNALSPEETDVLSRILSATGAAAGRPELARFKRALAHDRGGRAGFERSAAANNGAAADAVLDIEAERL
ncbi:hypothetical protein COCOBI_02-0740 [Coccomyxa sp. Obi]|nr:hypothetical protein COCOBI_02-0740 [Coccomyxa sp. Obi]